jgi:hypothetical protein
VRLSVVGGIFPLLFPFLILLLCIWIAVVDGRDLFRVFDLVFQLIIAVVDAFAQVLGPPKLTRFFRCLLLLEQRCLKNRSCKWIELAHWQATRNGESPAIISAKYRAKLNAKIADTRNSRRFSGQCCLAMMKPLTSFPMRRLRGLYRLCNL